jgi:hypothetical protein
MRVVTHIYIEKVVTPLAVMTAIFVFFIAHAVLVPFYKTSQPHTPNSFPNHQGE